MLHHPKGTETKCCISIWVSKDTPGLSNELYWSELWKETATLPLQLTCNFKVERSRAASPRRRKVPIDGKFFHPKTLSVLLSSMYIERPSNTRQILTMILAVPGMGCVPDSPHLLMIGQTSPAELRSAFAASDVVAPIKLESVSLRGQSY